MRHERWGFGRPVTGTKRIPLGLAALVCGLFVDGATPPLAAQTAQALAVVSAASYQSAPNSLASIFGTGLANELAAASFDESGKLPTELGGVQVTVNGRPAELIFGSRSR